MDKLDSNASSGALNILLALSMVVGRIYTLVGTDAAMRAVSGYLLASGYQGRYSSPPCSLVLGIAGRPILAWQLGLGLSQAVNHSFPKYQVPREVAALRC